MRQLCFSVTAPRSLCCLHAMKYRYSAAGLIRIAPPCLQKSDDVCSQYRKWLSAVSECTKALTASKTRLEEAKKDMAEREEDLNILVNEAGTFMQKEQARAAKRAKRHAQRCAGPCVPARQAAMLTWGLGQGLRQMLK